MSNNYIKDFKMNNYNQNLKFDIYGLYGNKSWGISSFKTKTLYKYTDEGNRPATPEEEEENKKKYEETGKLIINYSFPSRYFIYTIHNNKPIILVENRDQKMKDGKIISQSDKYFKPATIDWHNTTDKFTHFVRGTNIPFLSITSKSNMNIKPSSVKPDTVFHVNNKGWIIQEKVKIKGNSLWTENGDKYPIIWNQKGRLMK